MYYISENLPNSCSHWLRSLAKTLTGAKRQASRLKVFQGTIIRVGYRAYDEGKIMIVAQKADKSVWHDIEGSETC